MTFWENIPNPHLKCRCDSSSFSKHEFQYSRTWDRIFCFFWFHFFHRAVNRHSKDSSCTSSGEFIGFLGAGRSSMQSSSLSVSSPDWKTARWLTGPFCSRQLALSNAVCIFLPGHRPQCPFWAPSTEAFCKRIEWVGAQRNSRWRTEDWDLRSYWWEMTRGKARDCAIDKKKGIDHQIYME